MFLSGILNQHSPGGGAWSIEQVDKALWLDASDTSSVITSGGLVTQWNDKSGNGRNHVVANSSPTLSSLNGLQTVNFNGTNQAMLGASGITTTSSFSLFLVSNTSVGRGLDGSGSGWSVVSDTSGLYIVHTYPTVASKGLAFLGTGVLRTNIFNQGVGISGGKGGAFSSLSFTQTNLRTSGIDSTLGRGATVTNYVAGYIAEYIIITSVVSTPLRQQIEGYLAHKWGLTADLPSDHPYKSVAP